jgi:16S rRNA (uracil1498-N3)-methyltransferase
MAPADVAPVQGRGAAFFLAGPPRDGRVRLLPDEERHARRVLRVRAGDALRGLDGQGGVWPLRVLAAGRGLEVEVSGPPRHEPAPGVPGAPLPWIEVGLSLPRGGRAEDCVGRLVQLGVAAIQPLVCERTQGADRALGAARRRRLERAVDAACKQCGRAWRATLHAPLPALEWAERSAAARALLVPGAPERLFDWAQRVADGQRADARRPLQLAVGPEGGWTVAEEQHLQACGAAPVALGPFVLRIETAAEAAAAVLAHALFLPTSSSEPQALAQRDVTSAAEDHVIEQRDAE